MVRNKNEVFGYIKSLLLRAVGKVSKPHVLVSRVPDSTGSDPERKITGTKLTSTWLDQSAARDQFFLVKLSVALICLILLELKLSRGSHSTWEFTEAC